MDRVDEYRTLVQSLLGEYGSIRPTYGDVEFETIFDKESDRYQLMAVGWEGKRRMHGCVAHVDIKGGKVWIQHDGTEEGIANRLVAAGVPRDNIVLAFHAPYKRPA
ncbi:MAG: XisI protein, partial [Phycisphaerales bacterium]|nr:XisI protein [Phycisphaerales bacterium]